MINIMINMIIIVFIDDFIDIIFMNNFFLSQRNFWNILIQKIAFFAQVPFPSPSLEACPCTSF